MHNSRCEPVPSLQDTLVSNRQGLVKAAMRITGCHSRAEDVVQDAYFRVNTLNTAQLSLTAQLSYVFRVVRNLAIDHYRKQALEQRYVGNDEQDLAMAPTSITPESVNTHRQTLSTVERALAELPERTRYAFVMYRVHGRQQKDIAAELGVSPTLVNFMIRDALVHCRRYVAAEDVN